MPLGHAMAKTKHEYIGLFFIERLYTIKIEIDCV